MHPALLGIITGLVIIVLAGVYPVWADVGGHWSSNPACEPALLASAAPTPAGNVLHVLHENAPNGKDMIMRGAPAI
jgi:hypothetical protein